MRELNFTVNGQSLEKDSSCDFTGIVKGTKGYLKASFETDYEWNNKRLVAVFYGYGVGNVYVPVKDGSCIVPEEVLGLSSWYVSLVGVSADKEQKITTNKVEVQQNE